MRPIAFVLLLAALIAPATASAATARTEEVCSPGREGPECSMIARFDAAAGEANDVRVQVDDQVTLFSDAGAPIVAGEGCTRVDDHSVRCAATKPTLDTGDGDDRVTGTLPGTRYVLARLGPGDDHASGVSAEGEDGNDVLVDGGVLDGGAGDDELRGDADRNRLIGGPGSDVLHAGAGDDSLFAGDLVNQAYRQGWEGTPAPLAPDDVDGGPGKDELNLAAETRALAIDLLTGATDGAAAGDTIRGIEDLWSGSGADVIRGTDGPNHINERGGGNDIDARGGNDRVSGGVDAERIAGGDGDDVLSGSGGNDTIAGGAGDDHLGAGAASTFDGGDGDDAFTVYGYYTNPGGRPADVRCGEGADRVEIQRRAAATADCERVTFGQFRVLRPVRLVGRTVVLALSLLPPWRGTLVLRDARSRERLATRRLRGRYGGQRVRLRISGAAATALRRSEGADLMVEGVRMSYRRSPTRAMRGRTPRARFHVG